MSAAVDGLRVAEALARAVAEAENAGIEAADLHAMLDVLLEEN